MTSKSESATVSDVWGAAMTVGLFIIILAVGLNYINRRVVRIESMKPCATSSGEK